VPSPLPGGSDGAGVDCFPAGHLVGEREQRWRHLEAERLCGLEVDRELVLGRCLYRQVGRLLALEDAVDVSGGVRVLVKQIGLRHSRIRRSSGRSARKTT
jgi:hypothetical protein